MNSMTIGTVFIHQIPPHSLTLLSFFFALGISAFLFLLSQEKFTAPGRIVIWVALGKLALCAAVLFLIGFMHHIVRVIFSWLPNRRRNDHPDIEGGDDPSPHHQDQEALPQAQLENVVTLLQMFLMEVLDRVWEDMVMEEGQEQRIQTLRVQGLEALPPPLQYCEGGCEIKSSCCSDQCAICLEDFVDGESCRVFACKHMFHSNCIDHWLRNHLTCPVCRNSVLN